MADPSLLDLSRRLLAGDAISGRHPLDMRREVTLEELGDGLAFVEAFANVTALATEDGLVLVDTSGPFHAGKVHEAIRRWTAAPLHTAVFTHGHVDHIYAVASFEAEEGAGPARVVAHEALPERFRRYELTSGYNAIVNQRQFRLGAPIFPGGYRYPDVTYRSAMSLTVGTVDLELRHDRGETDDGTWVWLADRRVLCTGDLFIWASPNCGNPQKVQRYCDEWAAALRTMAALRPELLLPGHGLPIAGEDQIQQVLGDTAELLESLFTQTIEMMNAGARLDEVVHTVAAPPHLLERPWLRPVYDEPEFVVRNIWRLYGGWYDGDPSHLKPAPAGALATALAELVPGGAERLAQRALELSDAGEHRLAGHLVELATQAATDPATNPDVWLARATVFERRAALEPSTMSKGVFGWAEAESLAAIPPDRHVTSLLFVCLGNICRSPTAEGVMAHLVVERGLDGTIRCDSAGTGGWHVGDLPDRRAHDEARRHGIELTHRGRQVRSEADLASYDLVLAMDQANLADLRRMAPSRWAAGDIRLLRSFDPEAADDEVPDPYYGGAEDFADVFSICETACAALLDELLERRHDGIRDGGRPPG